ncbi:DUF2911 domain-containing protein [Flavihumibacter rivuli]|uniref:DUF2911 domain-containing protein n=1 Tax=Flavihumibacter rivuli TaxID=2838156 RepID=UPI001BDE842E|nr:DUF2911 domain-containing protein [Flavihumibacter rivuli]ULQ58239.1 DUF2911 domain-containing protein [Flavihumibacter rivuli]
MSRLLLVALTLLLNGVTGRSYAQAQPEEVCYNPNAIKDTTKKSIKSMAIGVVGTDSITIAYHSPGVRKRVIWGGLVPLDEVWVTGAHNATAITFHKPLLIGGITIAPGKYAIFTIPGQDKWIFILNKNWNQHLASEYDQKDDLVRLEVKPVPHEHTERLQYLVEPVKGNDGQIVFLWEKLKWVVPFSSK